MKSIFKLGLFSLLLAPATQACTDVLIKFDVNAVTVTQAIQGKTLVITIPLHTTAYSGSNGNGPVTLTVTSTGPFTIQNFSTDAQYGQSAAGTLTITGTPTTGGVETGTFNFLNFCGTFASRFPDSLPYNITATPTTTIAPPTFFANPFTADKIEPVSMVTGELFGHDETADLNLRGPLPLSFRRYYASYLSANGIKSALGTNWMHNFDVTLAVNGNNATVTLFRGQTVKFTKSGNFWQPASTERRPYQLAPAGSGYQFMSPVTNLIYTFDSTGALTKVEDRNGNALTVTQAPGGVGPAQISDGLGRTLTFTYTGSNLTSVKDHSGRTVNFEYAGGNLTAFTNALGKRKTFSYTTAGTLTGLMTAETRPLANKPYTQQFDAQGRVSSQADALSNLMNLAYTASGNGATVTEPGGVSITDTHDANRNLTSESDPSGASNQYTYDANGRPTSVTDRLGKKSTAAWDAASGLPLTYTDQLGNTTTYKYASAVQGSFTFYDLASVRFADGTSISYTRDGKGNPITYTDQAGYQFQATYNARGQILTFSNPAPPSPTAAPPGKATVAAHRDDMPSLGPVTTFTYNPDGTLKSVKLPTDDFIQIAYDSLLRRNQVTNPDLTTRQYVYDGLDNLLSATNEQGQSTTFTFDDNGNRKTVTDPLNGVTTFTYDGLDRLVATTNPLGKTTKLTFDATARPQILTDPLGVTTAFNYNALNQLTSVVDANGKAYKFASDLEARLLQATDPLGFGTSATRDPRGSVTGITDANKQLTAYGYDALNRLTTITDPLKRTGQLVLDPRGLATQFILPGGITESFGRNELGAINQFTDPNGNVTRYFLDLLGRPVSETDPLGRTTQFAYDALGRRKQVTLPDQSVINLTVSPVGNLLKITYADGTTRSYTYDALNRMVHANGADFAYNAASQMVMSNGIQNTFNDAGQIASVQYAPGKLIQYAYNGVGQNVKVTDWTGATINFGYDAAGQETSRTFPNGVGEVRVFDPAGNLLSTTASKGGTTLFFEKTVFDGDNRPLSVTLSNVPEVPNGTTPLAWDPADQRFDATYNPLGQLIADQFGTYAYNPAGDLTSYNRTDGAASFKYDGLSRLNSKTTGDATQNYILNYALPGAPVSIVQSGGAPQLYYILTPNGVPVASVDPSTGAHQYFHFNGSGSTSALTDGAGNVIVKYAYTPLGETVSQTGTVDNPITFLGAFGFLQQGTTGLFYNPVTDGFYNSFSASDLDASQENSHLATGYRFPVPGKFRYIPDVKGYLEGTSHIFVDEATVEAYLAALPPDDPPGGVFPGLNTLPGSPVFFFSQGAFSGVTGNPIVTTPLLGLIQSSTNQGDVPTPATPFLFLGDDRPHRPLFSDGHLFGVGVPSAGVGFPGQPPNDAYFQFIQKLRELRITNGTTPANNKPGPKLTQAQTDVLVGAFFCCRVP